LLSFQLFFLMFGLAEAPRAEEDPSFSQRELDRMLAPIALYPDVVLSQVLMAATYPLEVVEAARWSKANPPLASTEAVEAVEDKDWDASVKALVAFPRLLARMDEDLEWTKRVGDAFLFQQAEVMGTIQDLRRRAYEAGNLDDLDHARVIEDGDTILIEPADSEIMYIPYYDTRVIYGGWWWPSYPPHCWTPPGYYLGTGFYWSGGVPYSSGLYFSYVSWPHRHIVVIKSRHVHVGKPGHAHRHDYTAQGGARHWQHDPRHRRGAVYRDRGSSHKYGRPRASSGGEHAGIHHADRTRDGQYRHGTRVKRTAEFGDGRRKYAGRSDTPRASAHDGGRPQGKRFVGKRRQVATTRAKERSRDTGEGNRSGAGREAVARPPRALAAQRGDGREAGYYYHPRQAASRTAQAFAPNPGANGQRMFTRR
jgi:hypothetical protein